METGRERSPSEEDQISKLTDELIHHILSFIHMKYSVRTCVLSKRWRYVGTSLPTLNFDYTKKLYSRGVDFVNVVDKVLKHRNNELYSIQRFYLNKTKPRSYISLLPLYRWIGVAIKANIEDIYFGNNVGGRIVKELFTCTSLKRLTLMAEDMCLFLPESIYLPHLVYLKLYNSFLDGDDLNKLIASCPVLEDLDLTLNGSWPMSKNHESMNVKICSTTLKHLEIRNSTRRMRLCLYAPNLVSLIFESATNDIVLDNICSMVDATMSKNYDSMNIRIHSATVKHLEIRNGSGRITSSLYAPNLVSLIFGVATNDIVLENVSSMVDATIDTKESSNPISDDPKAYPQRVLKFLEAPHNMKYLTLSAAPLKVIAGVPNFLENEVSQFRNLQRLKLLHAADFSSTNSIFVIASFLKISPNIESLTMELTGSLDSDSDSYSYSDSSENFVFNKESSEQEKYLDKMKSDLEMLGATFELNSLKTLEISGFQGSVIEMKLVEILLMKASILEKLYLFYERGFRKKIQRKKILDDVAAFKRDSPSVAILFT